MSQRRCMGCMAVTENAVCEHCGYPQSFQNEPHQLPVGTLLRGQYQVGRVLGQGGFGITYLGWDTYLDMPVAIKEYYPNTYVNRECTRSLTVHCYTEQMRPAYTSSKERFLREAKALAKLEEIPAIVRIRGFFPENETAYIVMEYVRGTSLQKYVSIRGGRLSADETLRILRPVMEALAAVHRSDLIHRDISPDNIILHPQGGPKLLDFGAVRTVENPDAEKDMQRSTESILKHGFAPIEQYQSRGSLGPWTDVYALCATIYYCLTGCVPEDAPARMVEESEIDWASIPGLTDRQRRTLEKAMAVRAKNRIASMEELMDGLYAPEPKEEPEPVSPKPIVPEPPKPKEPKPVTPKTPPQPVPARKRSRARWPRILALCAAVIVAAGLALVFFGQSGWYYKGGHHTYYQWPGIKLKDSWLEFNGKYYYLDEDGYMEIGFRTIKGKTYWFDETGVMATGWTEIDGNTYYFNSLGVMLSGKWKIGDRYYFFDDYGRLQE